MHLDSVGSEQDPSPEIKAYKEDAAATSSRHVDSYSDDEADAEEDGGPESAPAPREGLPARFRMRHTSHYVDALLGDAPLRTVREIPVSEIEPPDDDQAELEELERSIRQLGVIEPLLVGRRGASYRVIAGMRRLRAAQRAGLDTVPCLVHDVDEERLASMRGAAAFRVTIPPPAPEPLAEAPPLAEAFHSDEPVAQTHAAAGEAIPSLEFVSALLPAMNAAGGNRLRWSVLTDLASVELSHAKVAGAALDILSRPRSIDRTSVDYQVLVSDVIAGISTEARLRNVRLDVSLPGHDNGRDIFLDGAICRDALTGMLQALLALAPRAGGSLHVAAQMTSIRPALILECLARDSDPELGPEAFQRFFEAGWREHPCGANGGALLAAFAQIARAHGGRVDVKPSANGCLVTFVVPRMDG